MSMAGMRLDSTVIRNVGPDFGYSTASFSEMILWWVRIYNDFEGKLSVTYA